MIDVSPIIIDNTNIKANESKAYVVKALEVIKIVIFCCRYWYWWFNS
jgi:hypothetical protein